MDCSKIPCRSANCFTSPSRMFLGGCPKNNFFPFHILHYLLLFALFTFHTVLCIYYVHPTKWSHVVSLLAVYLSTLPCSAFFVVWRISTTSWFTQEPQKIGTPRLLFLTHVFRVRCWKFAHIPKFVWSMPGWVDCDPRYLVKQKNKKQPPAVLPGAQRTVAYYVCKVSASNSKNGVRKTAWVRDNFQEPLITRV